MKIICVTGNTGGGKSSLIKLLTENKDTVSLNADEINAEILKHSEYLTDALNSLCRGGNAIPVALKFNKKLLREKIIESRNIREAVSNLLHPLIYQNLKLQCSLLPKHDYCFIEIPLFFETPYNFPVDSIILITAKPEKMVERIRKRNALSINESQEILAIQYPDNHKIKYVTDLVVNHDHISRLNRISEKLYSAIKSEKQTKITNQNIQ